MRHRLAWLCGIVIGLWLLLCHGAISTSAADSKKEDDPFTRAVDDELRKRIDTAIETGVQWLAKQQKPEGNWNSFSLKVNSGTIVFEEGPTALAVYTLLKCGMEPQNPALENAFAYLRAQDIRHTYTTALVIMALEAKWNVLVYEKGGSAVKSAACDRMPKADREWMTKLADHLVKIRKKPTWRYPGEENEDNSNTQFALLGLAAAARCGYPVPEDVWLENLNFFLETQEKSTAKVKHVIVQESKDKNYKTTTRTVEGYARGWCYGKNYSGAKGKSYGSMTCVGVASLILCQQELIRLKSRKYDDKVHEKVQQAVEDGLTWVEQHYTLTENPVLKEWHYYYLYSLERAGVLAQRVHIGEHHWYVEGATFLCDQQAGGAWNNDIADTCFALLFLKRASRAFARVTSGAK